MRLGTDIVWIPEIEQSVAQFGDRYLYRLFSLQELQDCRQGQQLNYQKLAARVAAKEATMKILDVNNNTAIPWTSIEVVRHGNGRPRIRLHREAKSLAQAADLDECVLSLSHDQDYAIATVVTHGKAPIKNRSRNSRSVGQPLPPWSVLIHERLKTKPTFTQPSRDFYEQRTNPPSIKRTR